MAEFATINEYIASFPTDVQPALESIRETIHNTVPGLDETISYQMPTMTVHGKNLIHFAGWKKTTSRCTRSRRATPSSRSPSTLTGLRNQR